MRQLTRLTAPTGNRRTSSKPTGHSREPLVTSPAFDVAGKRVLLVDDVARTGATLRAAAGALAGAAASHTLVVAGCADYALFQVDSCIAWPWQAEAT